MKRILLGTSALSILAVTGAVNAQAQQSNACAIENNVYICNGLDANDTTSPIAMDLSSSSTGTEFLFTNTTEAASITASQGVDTLTIAGATFDEDGNELKSGQVKFSDLNTLDGDDVIMVSAAADGATKAGELTQVNLDTGDGNDTLLVGGSIKATSNEAIVLGAGNDRVEVTGSLDQQVDGGAGDDVLINEGSIFAAAGIKMGEGNDLVQNSNIFTGAVDLGADDDILRLINSAPGTQGSNVVMDGGEGYDELQIMGTANDSRVDMGRTANFEKLIKSGEGTWSVETSETIAADAYAQGIYNTEGTLNFSNVDGSAVEVSAYIQNQANLGGNLQINADADFDASGTHPASLYNSSTGVVGANLTFSEHSDLFVNDGRIQDSRFDGTQEDVFIDMGAGSDEFRNSGSVSGTVDLSDGDDRFALTGDTLFDIQPAGRILGGANGEAGDIIELAGVGGRLMEVNCASCAISEFEGIDVTAGEWSFSADQNFNGDIRATGGMLTISTDVRAQNLIIDGGYVMLPGEFQGLDTQVNSGTLEILNGLLSSPLTVGESGFVKGTGTVSGETVVAGNITPADFNDADGNAIGVLEIDNSFTVTETGRVTINVDPANDEWDRFDVSGFLTIDDGAEIEVIPTSALEDGQYFEIDIAKAGLVEGEFTIAADSAFTDYQIIYDEADQVKILVGASNAPIVFSTAAVSGNNPIYTHLSAENSAGGTINTFFLNFVAGGLTAKQQANLNEVSPEWYESVYGMAKSYANNFGSAMARRIGDKEWCGTMQGAGEADCRAHRGDSGDVWGSLVAYNYSNSKSAVSDTEGSAFAGIIGADQRFGLATFGLAGGFGITAQDVNDSGSAAGFGANFGGYFSLPMEVANLDGDIGYTYGKSTSERKVDTSWDSSQNGTSATGDPNNLDGNYDGILEGEAATHTISAGLRLTQEYKNQAGIEFQPSVGVRVNRTLRKGFTETANAASTGTSVGDLALIIRDNTHTDASVEIGGAVRKSFQQGNGSVFTPEVRGKLSRMFMGQEVETQGRFVGSDGTTNGTTNDFTIVTEQSTFTYDLGAALQYRTQGGMTVFGEYDYSGGDDQSSHKGALGARFDF